MRRAAGEDDHPALGIELDLTAFEGTDPGAFDICAEADASVHTPALLLIAGPPVLVVADSLEQLFEDPREAGGVIDDLFAVAVGHVHPIRLFSVGNQVAPYDVDRLEVKRLRYRIDDAVHHERRLRPPSAPVRQVEHLVRQHALGVDGEVGDRVHAAEVGGHVVGAAQRIGASDPRVEDEPVAHGGYAAFVVERNLGVVDLVAGVSGGDQVLLPVLHPAHRLADDPRDVREQDLLGIDLDLAAETSTDMRRDHAHLPLSRADLIGDGIADDVWDLRRAPQGDLLADTGGEDAAGFHGGRRNALASHPQRERMGRLRESPVGITDADPITSLHIVGDVLIDDRRARLLGSLRIDHGGKILVFDEHQFSSVLCEVARLGHHRRHRLTDVAHLAVRKNLDRCRQDLRVGGLKARGWRLLVEDQRCDVIPDIGARENGDDSVESECGGGVDPRDAGVR